MRLTTPRLKRLLLWSVLATVLWLLSSLAVACYFTRRPHAQHDEPVPTVAWAKLQPLRLRTPDGEELGAWFHAGRAGQPLVLLLHGKGDSCRNSLPRAEMAAGVGCGTLLLSMRAHGSSTGTHNDFGYSARHDVVAAVAWLERQQPGRPIVVWGESQGSAAAIFAARELGTRVRGYLLETPYRDLRTAVWNRTQMFLPPLVDRVAYAGLMTVAPLVLDDVDALAPVDAIAGIPAEVPVTILAGELDDRARPAEAQALAERLPGHARLILFAGGGHGHFEHVDPVGYRTAMLELLMKSASAHARRSPDAERPR